jgi:hypothetical protein
MKQPLNPQTKPVPKKPYSAPEIQVYGDFRDITNTSTNIRQFRFFDHGHANRTR